MKRDPFTVETANPPPRLALTSREAAESIGVSERTLQTLDIPFVRLPGGRLKLFPISELQRWLTNQARSKDEPT